MIELSKRGNNYNTPIMEFEGLSTDTKPTIRYNGDRIPNGSTYDEIDTGKKYAYDMENGIWYEAGSGGGGSSRSYKETVLYDTWNAFAQNVEITLSDDATKYDALLIVTSYHETGGGNDYYYHLDSTIIPKDIVTTSIAETPLSGTYRGIFDIKGSLANLTYYMLWNAKFTANNKLQSTAKYTGSFPAANCGIHKIIGIKY